MVLSSCSLFVAQTPYLVYLFHNLVVGALRNIVLTTLARLKLQQIFLLVDLRGARLIFPYGLLQLCDLSIFPLLDSPLLVPFLLSHFFVLLPLVHQGKIILDKFDEVTLELFWCLERQ